MLDSLRRMHTSSTIYSVSMWVMEFLVLALIAYEVVTELLHRRKMKSIHGSLFAMMQAGQKLLWNMPRGDSDTDAWEKSAKAWIQETAKFLESSSPKAAAWFLQEVDASYYEVEHDAFFWNTALFHRLSNLREIMEKLDLYF